MKSKGFTLIELLAVIVILAIIALIATPIILNMINNVKESASENSLNNIIKAVDLYFLNNMSDNPQEEIFYCNKINCSTDNGNTLKFDGEVPSGNIIINQSGDTFFALQFDNICFRKKSIISETIKDYEFSTCYIYNINSYIKDGLILHYDGIYNTRNGHNDDTLIWEDLSGNNNDAIFVNNNGSIQYSEKGYEFTNNSDYVKSSNALGLSKDPNITIEFVGKFYGYQTGHTMPGFFTMGNTTSRDGESLTGFFRNDKNYIFFGTVNTSVKILEKLSINEIFSISYRKKEGTFNIENASIYMNGMKKDVIESKTVTMNYLDTPIQIGRAWQFNNQNRTFNGIIYSVRVYNRVLTEEEIKHNYEVDKYRYFD